MPFFDIPLMSINVETMNTAILYQYLDEEDISVSYYDGCQMISNFLGIRTFRWSDYLVPCRYPRTFH
jgi:hypothetical protein